VIASSKAVMPLITEIGDGKATAEPRSEAKASLITEVSDAGQLSPLGRTAQRKEPFLPWIEGGSGGSSSSSSAVGGGRAGGKAAGGFTAATSFSGAKTGHVFKLGSRGLGYYRDDDGVAATSQGAAADGDDGGSDTSVPAIEPTTEPVAQAAALPQGSKLLAHVVERAGGKLVVKISLPGRNDTRGVVLAVMGTTAYSDLTLRVEGFDELRVRLPAVVDQKNVKAKFSKASQRLNVQLLVVAECGRSSSSSTSTAARPRSARRHKTPQENHAKSTNKAAKPKEEKPNLDDLKICTQCGGLGQYTDKQDIRCGLQGQRFSGLQRVLTYECPTCEGDGYVNSKKLAAKKANSTATPEDCSTAPAPRDIAKWDDVKRGSTTGDAEWEMVDAAASSSSSNTKPQSSTGAGCASAQSDAAAYQAFKDNMDPAKRAEFEKILAEARSTDGSA